MALESQSQSTRPENMQTFHFFYYLRERESDLIGKKRGGAGNNNNNNNVMVMTMKGRNKSELLLS